MRSYRIPPHPSQQTQENSEGIGVPGSPYPGSYVEAPSVVPFASSSQIAYRGAEPHGVPTGHYATVGTVDPASPEVQTQGPDSATVPWYDNRHGEDAPDPVPVRVVESQAPVTMRRMFAVSTVPLSPVTGGALPTAVQVFSQRHNRTKLRVTVKRLPTSANGPDRVWISSMENPGPMNGLALDGGDPSFDSNTTEDGWAVLDPASCTNGALLQVYTEYEVAAVEHTH